MALTKMDPIQIQRASFDEEKMANRVVMAPTEMSIELNHEDGDSVYSHQKMQVIQCKAGQVVDTSHVDTICCTTSVALSAVILNKEMPFATLSRLTPLAICVPAVKVATDCVLILRG